jgi:endoglucanase
MRVFQIACSIIIISSSLHAQTSWIRINQLGYKPQSKKIAVWCAKDSENITTFSIVDSASRKTVFTNKAKRFGSYGPFSNTARLDFSLLQKNGVYMIKAGKTISAYFRIGPNVYKGTADFCLRYMRQQRCGFNPFLKDSCHTHDGYTVYGPMPDGTHIDVTGGWHDASDYLQYVTTSANATYHLMMAYRDFPNAFTDEKDANGLDGKNDISDVMDEAKWGLDWLVKMNPSADIMFNQIADDRDHHSLRIPKEDSFYNKGFERPVYFVTGEPQGLFQYKNRTTGTSSTAGKFAAAFALAQYIFSTGSLKNKYDLQNFYYGKALDALKYGEKKPGFTQTAPGHAPYFYEEANWNDDMELGAAAIHNMIVHTKSGNDGGFYLSMAFNYAGKEKITPWFGSDTARHYEWYPFVNIGHYEMLRLLSKYSNETTDWKKRFYAVKQGRLQQAKDSITKWYREGIALVWNKAKQNAFFRGVPFIWCSNNLTTSFATQCYWYKKLTGDKSFEELEQANFDWLFGCNPWGTSMVYGLPANGDTPVDPHSAFTHLKQWPIDGGLIDGPVKASIFNNLKGLKLYNEDSYGLFQSPLAVYHDDFGDYSTNEPTMDGTASLIYLLAAMDQEKNSVKATNPKRK